MKTGAHRFGNLSRKESTLEDKCRNIATKYGLRFEKRTNGSGTFDRILYGRPIAPWCGFIELKNEEGTGVVSIAQAAERRALDEMKYPNLICDNLDDFKSFCLKLLYERGAND